MPEPDPTTTSAPSGPPVPLWRRGAAFPVALYVAWLSAGPIPFDAAYYGAKSPTDFTRDFIAAKVLARGEPLSTLDGARGNAEAVRAGAEPVIIIENSPFHLHPPPASVPIRLLVPLGFRGASALWLALSIALLGVLARVLVATFRRVGGDAPVGPTVLFLLLIVWPPTLTNLQLGQWSIALATIVALGFDAWDRGRRLRGAAWLAAATALKLTPAGLFPFIFLRDRRAAGVFVAVVLAAVVVAIPVSGGLDAWMAFHRDAGVNVTQWQTWWHNTLSLNGFIGRLFVGAHFARPLVRAPLVARGLFLGASVALGVTALGVTREDGRARGPAHDGCVFALWNILIVVLNPLAWTHYALLLLLPAALILRAAHDPRSSLSNVARARLRRSVAVAIVVLTIPKETAYLIVRPLPSAPVMAPLLSLHMFAGLLLFAAALGAIVAQRSGARSCARPSRRTRRPPRRTAGERGACGRDSRRAR